jgi:hypothetical protein
MVQYEEITQSPPSDRLSYRSFRGNQAPLPLPITANRGVTGLTPGAGASQQNACSSCGGLLSSRPEMAVIRALSGAASAVVRAARSQFCGRDAATIEMSSSSNREGTGVQFDVNGSDYWPLGANLWDVSCCPARWRCRRSRGLSEVVPGLPSNRWAGTASSLLGDVGSCRRGAAAENIRRLPAAGWDGSWPVRQRTTLHYGSVLLPRRETHR